MPCSRAATRGKARRRRKRRRSGERHGIRATCEPEKFRLGGSRSFGPQEALFTQALLMARRSALFSLALLLLFYVSASAVAAPPEFPPQSVILFVSQLTRKQVHTAVELCGRQLDHLVGSNGGSWFVCCLSGVRSDEPPLSTAAYEVFKSKSKSVELNYLAALPLQVPSIILSSSESEQGQVFLARNTSYNKGGPKLECCSRHVPESNLTAFWTASKGVQLQKVRGAPANLGCWQGYEASILGGNLVAWCFDEKNGTPSCLLQNGVCNPVTSYHVAPPPHNVFTVPAGFPSCTPACNSY